MQEEKESKADTFETDDLALAAYLKMQNVEMVDYGSNHRKVVFVFADGDGICKKLHIKFLNSECKRFDSVVRDLKKLLK
jgi:hypothetical protein